MFTPPCRDRKRKRKIQARKHDRNREKFYISVTPSSPKYAKMQNPRITVGDTRFDQGSGTDSKTTKLSTFLFWERRILRKIYSQKSGPKIENDRGPRFVKFAQSAKSSYWCLWNKQPTQIKEIQEFPFYNVGNVIYRKNLWAKDLIKIKRKWK